MVILNYNNKKYIEITEDEVIFYRFYGKRRLKLDNIRACYMDDNYRIIILYNNGIRSYGIPNVKPDNKVALGILVDKLNKNQVVFSSQYVLNWWIWIGYFPIAFINIKQSHTILGVLFWIIYIVVIASIMGSYVGNNGIFIYDIEAKLIKVGANEKKMKIYKVKEDNYYFDFKKENNAYFFKRNKKKNRATIIIPRNVIYPIYYKEKLDELYNLSNDIADKEKQLWRI